MTFDLARRLRPRQRLDSEQLRRRIDAGVDTAIDVVAGIFPVVLFVLAVYVVGSFTLFWNAGF